MGARILVVEDNALLALDLTQALQADGFEILGPAMTVGQALNLIQRGGCDAAVLDLNLRGETSEAIAQALLARSIPFITMTGYTSTQRPAIFDGALTFTKPVVMPRLIDGLRECLGPAATVKGQ